MEHVGMHVQIRTYILYIYIQRERERNIYTHIHTSIHVYIYIHTHVYTYTYTYTHTHIICAHTFEHEPARSRRVYHTAQELSCSFFMIENCNPCTKCHMHQSSKKQERPHSSRLTNCLATRMICPPLCVTTPAISMEYQRAPLRIT
jgi:hypothetical protein